MHLGGHWKNPKGAGMETARLVRRGGRSDAAKHRLLAARPDLGRGLDRHRDQGLVRLPGQSGDMSQQAQQNDYRRKIKSRDELRTAIGPRPREKKVIMCHGTFDLVHPGHIRHLMYAKSKADILVASLTSDSHIN